MNGSKNLVLYAALVGVGAVSSAAWSQTDGEFSYRLEEIVVTAQKREESLQDIPKQVQVVSMNQMDNANVTAIDELVKLIPSMNGDNGGDDAAMRGVSTAAPSIGANSKVGITLDGVPIPSRATGVRTLLDIQQIEVLPGPQGTLAGRNATGGLINLVTSRPSMDGFTGNVQAKSTDDHEYQYGVLLSGPISDNLAYSFTANKQYLRGLRYNIFNNKWQVEKDFTGFKGKLLWTPDAQTDVTFSYTNSTWKTSGGYNWIHWKLDIPSEAMWSSLERVSDGMGGVVGNNDPTGKTTYDELYPGLRQYIGEGNNKYYSEREARSNRGTDFATLTWERDLANGTVTVLGSWLDETFPTLQNWADYSFADLEIRPDFNGYANIINYSKQKTLEARYASNTDQPFSYIAGVFWSDGENRYDYERIYLTFAADRRFGTTTKAIFGSTSYDFGQGTIARFGMRYEQDDIDYIWNYRALPAISKTTSTGVVLDFPAYGYPSTSNEASDSYVNYDLGLTHHVSDDLMVYLNYASANQGPIFDAEYIEGSQSGDPLEPLPAEEVKSVEAGVKTTLWDGRMVLNFNIFDMDFTNYQALTNVTDPTNPNSQPILKTYAAGSVKAQGVELISQTRLTESFRVDLSAIYNIAEITDWPNAPCYGGQTEAQGCVDDLQENIAGNRLESAAKVKYTLAGTYSGELSVFGGLGYDLSMTLAHTGDSQGDQLGDPLDYNPSITTLDANLSFSKGPVSVSLFGVNLTEAGEQTFNTGINRGLISPGYNRNDMNLVQRANLNRNLNRYLGVRLKYNFE